MTPHTKLLLAAILLLVFLWAFTLWIIWQPYKIEAAIWNQYAMTDLRGH
jgi:hypothetical protein